MRGVPPGKRSARRERKEGGTMTNMLENAQVSRRTFMKARRWPAWVRRDGHGCRVAVRLLAERRRREGQ